jgi:AraC family transcriptional regulator, melibiose operon regulatory protein
LGLIIMNHFSSSTLNDPGEAIPLHPELVAGHPMVVMSDHGFCAARQMDVYTMPGPHMHSQVELNFVLSGEMRYWFDGQEVSVSAGRLALFWGMVPHQVIARPEGTQFVCLYVPMSVFLSLPSVSPLRESIFRGAVIEPSNLRSYDRDIFLRWREELLTGDQKLSQIVRDELTARMRRIDHEGWTDLKAATAIVPPSHHFDLNRMHHVETMARYIAEHALEDISVEDVVKTSGLHPNYAMSLYKRAIGLTIKQSIMRHRLDTAQSLLISTDLPVGTISFDCGFGSLSSFYAAFEQRFHTSPAAYRKTLGPNRTTTVAA